MTLSNKRTVVFKIDNEYIKSRFLLYVNKIIDNTYSINDRSASLSNDIILISKKINFSYIIYSLLTHNGRNVSTMELDVDLMYDILFNRYYEIPSLELCNYSLYQLYVTELSNIYYNLDIIPEISYNDDMKSLIIEAVTLTLEDILSSVFSQADSNRWSASININKHTHAINFVITT